jgi:hypothetical protein
MGKSKSGDPQTDSCQFRIYRTTDAVNANGWRVAGGSNATGTATYTSALVPSSYGYVRYNQTGYWTGTSKASHAIRTFVFLQPQNGGEPYFIVQDKVTVSDASTRIPFAAWKVSFKPEILDGASKTLLDGPGTGSASNPQSDGESGEYTTTTAKWRVVNDKNGASGVLYATTLYPATRDTRLVGGDFNWAARDYTLVPAGSRLDTNRDTENRGGIYASHTPSNADLDGSYTYLTDAAARWFGRWRVEQREGGTPGTQQKFLTVFHPGRSTIHTTTADVVLLTSTDGTSMEGALIKDSGKWRVWLGPKAHSDATVSTAFQYTVTGLSGTAHHVLTGLTPNINYQVTRSTNTYTVTPNAGSITTTGAGTLEVTL